jgi:hypothetical protein
MQCRVTVTMEIERAIGNVSAVECCSKNFGRRIKKDTINKKNWKIHNVKYDTFRSEACKTHSLSTRSC